jgi:anti-sigma-K factor RskA
MSHEPFESQAAAYALGALDGEERVQFEEHLARGCETCRAALREHDETLAEAARELTPTIPPADVKAALMRRLAATGPRRASSRRWRTMRWALGTAAAVVGVSAFVAGLVASRYEARIGAILRETGTIRDDLRAQEAALRERLGVAQTVVALLRDPTTRVVALRGLDPTPTATGRVVWHERAGGHVFVANLPPPPAGKAYELWTISGGRPRPAGVFTVDVSGRGSQAVAPSPGPVDVFAVTLEPEAGVPGPTGPMVLASGRQ